MLPTRWMNRNPDKGSEWKGRIMVEYFAEDAKYPKARKASLNKEKAEAKLKQLELAAREWTGQVHTSTRSR